jgi:hypothetical protein
MFESLMGVKMEGDDFTLQLNMQEGMIDEHKKAI